MLPTSRGFIKAFLLNLVTLGFYNWYLIHCFAKETNIACAEDGRHTKGLLAYVLLNMITFGIYGIFWYCNWIERCNSMLLRHQRPQGLQMSTYLLTTLLLGVLTFGIMFFVVYAKILYLQNGVNGLYNDLNGFKEEPAEETIEQEEVREIAMEF